MDVTPRASATEQNHRTKGLLRLTMACNERCPFCNVPAEDYARKTPPSAEIDQQLQAFIEDGAGTLTISGGEPTLLRKRLVALVARARAGGIPFVELQTNAVLIDATYAAELAQAGLTSAFVSLLSHVPAHHDGLAGLNGAFADCLRGIDALLAQGIEVTLNPVLARQTQHLFDGFVAFVAKRLPGVTTISVSAVQPHGRAARGSHPEELLPDYSVLAEQIPRARTIAEAAGIRMVNPYCGLPLCVGWQSDSARSVEAFEAARGGWRPTLGIENLGDKRQDEACEACAWRTRCGGAWHAYWALRGGRGIVPPHVVVPPWRGSGDPQAQTIVDARAGVSEESFARLRAAVTPTVWLWAQQLTADSEVPLMDSGCTDLAVDLDPTGLASRRAARPTMTTLRVLHRMLRAMNRTALPASRQLRVHVRLLPAARPDQAAAVAWARQLGVFRVVRGGTRKEPTKDSTRERDKPI